MFNVHKIQKNKRELEKITGPCESGDSKKCDRQVTRRRGNLGRLVCWWCKVEEKRRYSNERNRLKNESKLPNK